MVDIYYRDDYCNSYLIYNDKLEAILVDPGYDGEKLIEHIKKLNLVVKSILLTHCHYDHIGALEEIFNYFDKPKVYVHELEFDSISNPRINLSRFNKSTVATTICKLFSDPVEGLISEPKSTSKIF